MAVEQSGTIGSCRWRCGQHVGESMPDGGVWRCTRWVLIEVFAGVGRCVWKCADRGGWTGGG